MEIWQQNCFGRLHGPGFQRLHHIRPLPGQVHVRAAEVAVGGVPQEWRIDGDETHLAAVPELGSSVELAVGPGSR